MHLASTTGAGVVIPEVYAVGTATEAESAYKGGGAGHGCYVLAHEATAFIYVRGVAAFLAFIFAFS